MLSNRLYFPENLSQIEQQNKYKNRPELYLKRQVCTEQRQLIKQILYMISGLQTEFFVKIPDEVEFDSEKGQVQKVFHYSLREDCRTQFTHLTYQTLKSCLEVPIKTANLIHFLNSKVKFIYEKSNNIFLKSFAQGIINFLICLNEQFTEFLTQLQKQSGRISDLKSINFPKILNQGELENITLLKLSYIFDQKITFIQILVSLVSRTLPYVSSQSTNQCQADNYMIVQILFNELVRLMDSIELDYKEKQSVLKIFSHSLEYYLTMIKNWIEMNPYLLQTQKHMPFFIELSRINFSLSKYSLNQSQNDQKLRNSSSYLTIDLKQKVYNSQEFIELFFSLKNLLVQEYIPDMFSRQGQCILQLGKIIQFINLYYSTEERPLLLKYFNVEEQFAKLFDLIKADRDNISQYEITSIFSSKFQKNHRQKVSVSQRLAQKKRRPLRNIRIESDNPYDMFSTTRGVFLDCQTTVSSIRTAEMKKIQPQNQSLVKIKYTKEKTLSVQQSFSIKFQRTLTEIIEKLYEKALFFFQQQTERQFFKTQSFTSIPSLTNISTFKRPHSIIQKPRMCSQMNSPLDFLPDKERIIRSISLTLIGIKKFMLYQQGDFFLELLTLVSHVFEGSCTKISRNLITSYIQEAIRSSSANNLPEQIKNNVTFLFIRKNKDPQIRHFKVWNVFSVLFRPQFPVNCIFNNEIMHGFGQIFNFIFNIKHCQHELKIIWEDFKQNSKIQTQYSLFQTKRHPFEQKVLAIRNNIHHFVNSVYSFIMISIESLWQEYIQEINQSFQRNLMQLNGDTDRKNKKLYNPISFLQLTQKLLKNLKLETIQNMILTNTMILVGEMLEKFKKLLKVQPDSKDWNDIIFKQQIQYIEHEFMGMMEMAKSIEGIGEAIFYNYS